MASTKQMKEPVGVLQPISEPMRDTVFVTHAAPEDNEFALWLSSKLALAGYRVWVDRRRLRGGDDFWDEIDRVLRNNAVKQIVVFTQYITKPGVKKELAIDEIMRNRLGDEKFMIPVRADDISFGDAPPELIRRNILNAYPNCTIVWSNCSRRWPRLMYRTRLTRRTRRALPLSFPLVRMDAARCCSSLMGVGRRQVFRLCRVFAAAGASGLVSRKRGRPSNRRRSSPRPRAGHGA
jgi:hypothetical protein